MAIMKYAIVLLTLLLSFSTIAQSPKVYNSIDIYNGLQKLNFLGSALYVAAHPDDENTRMISYLSNQAHARTAYLSLTRGDGGQNLIGNEIKELLGVIRTQELLAARRIDGGEQMFSRANDFGFSKNAEETRKIWEEEEVLADVVWAIRKFKPDIIINRFDHKSSGKTHGHHTASAILSYEAFDLSGDASKFSKQLSYVAPWKAKRLFFNTSWWFYGSRENFAEADKSHMVTVDIGTYIPALGKSNSEIAAESRSQHVCQGMGNTPRLGSYTEYLEFLKGDQQKNNDLFDGINTSWSRVEGGKAIGDKLEEIIRDFDFINPANSLTGLVALAKDIENIKDDHWKEIKLKEVKELITACIGLRLEFISKTPVISKGQTSNLNITAINRSEIPIIIKEAKLSFAEDFSIDSDTLNSNELANFEALIKIPESISTTAPYWLKKEGSLGMYKVEDQQLIGNPETQKPLYADIVIRLLDQDITLRRNIIHKYNDPEKGPVYRPVEITEAASVKINEPAYIFSDVTPQNISVSVKAFRDSLSGELALDVPNNWTVSPSTISINIDQKGASQTSEFKVTPPINADKVDFGASLTVEDNKYTNEIVEIDYDHIEYQIVEKLASSSLIKLDIKTVGRNLLYIKGAGDLVAPSLRQIGYRIEEVEAANVEVSNLKQYDAVIMGIRAYNKWNELKFLQKDLMQYVKDGGTMIVQYNTSRRLKVDQIGPYPIKLSRQRVTVEEAPVRILAKDHPVMNYPNKIDAADFEGWVQERGLYFASEWDEKYTPILSSNDPGEPARDGGFLVAEHGDGYFVYSSYSWFRELPAAVPGAYRIFANMIALGNQNRP